MFVVVGEGRMSARGKISSKTGDRKGRGRKRRSFFTERAHRPKRETMTDSKPKYRAGRLLALQLSRRGMTGCLLCDGAVERLLSVRFAAGKGLAEALREASDMGRLPEPVGDRTEISLDTDRVCLVPAELFDPSDAGSYLDVHGVSFDDADEVLVSSEVAGAIALMACEGEVCAFLRRRYGEVGFTHPLLDVLRVGPGDEVIEAVLSRDTVHLAAYASGLLYAATLPCRTEADLLYLLESVRRMFPDRMFRVALSGERPDGLVRSLGRRFRRVGAVRPALPGSVGHKEDSYRYASVIRMCYENR